MPTFASANRGTITKLVQGCRRYWSRSLAEIADVTPSWAERASSGVGCSRKERVSSVTRSRSVRAGGYALMASPTAKPGDQRVDAGLVERHPDADAQEHGGRRARQATGRVSQRQQQAEQADRDGERDTSTFSV